jgi:hypothetical protein
VPEQTVPTTTTGTHAPFRLIARLLSASERKRLTQALAAGRLRQREQIDILSQERLPQLAMWSLVLLILSGCAFVVFGMIAASLHRETLINVSALTVVLLIALNVLAYVVMIPLHEAVHAAVILALGGRPTFGLKWPLAAYCTAPGQLFTRNGYIAVAIAPLIVLSLVGVVILWFAPEAGICLIFGLAGNVSGAVGDLAVVKRMRRLPKSLLILDTETGYIAYEVE